LERLILIDGHAILHRAFHALPPSLTAPNGMSTNAIHGFMNMLLRVVEDLKPDFLVVCFDLPAPTFRMQVYTQYQSKRPEMIGNLKDQIGPMHELLTELKIPFFEVAGFEADDCIGTLAAQAAETRNLETIIVTGDRDMLQLVNSHVKVCVPVKGLSETKIYDEKTVVSEFRVKPSQWVDVKALKGDASDNYPGVPGIGPKTAEDLIAKFGTLERLYGKLGEVGKENPNLAKKLAEGTESAGMSQKLARIVTDVPGVHLRLEKTEVSKVDWGQGVEYMRKTLGFKSLPEKIEKNYINKNNKAVTQSHNKKEKSEGDPADVKALAGKQMRLV
jgi:DNA polymerase-1